MYQMQHAVAFVNTFGYSSTIKSARVTWLTTSGWIKRSAVQSNGGPVDNALTNIDDASVKFNQMGIGVIQTFSWAHGNPWSEILLLRNDDVDRLGSDLKSHRQIPNQFSIDLDRGVTK